ncbi:MAG: MarR family transcriptional regulator [Polyangiaceae bacterium]
MSRRSSETGRRSRAAQETASALGGRIAAECILMRSRRVNRVISKLYDDALRELSLSSAQLNQLVAISVGQPLGMRAIDLGRALDIEKSTLSRNLARMQDAGWIRQIPQGKHTLLELTPAGESLLAEAYPKWQAAQASAERLLGPQLTAALLKLEP